MMENDLVRVTILPQANAAITEYYFKPSGFNAILPVDNPKFALTKDVAVADTNFGGYKDWNFETRRRQGRTRLLLQNRGEFQGPRGGAGHPRQQRARRAPDDVARPEYAGGN